MDETTVTLNRLHAPAWVLAAIASGWEVWNAPRPICGTHAPSGEYAGGRGAIPNVPGSRGVFWAAIDPADTFAERFRVRNLSLDARRVVVLTDEAVRAAWEAECAARGHTVEEIVESWDGDWRAAARSCGYPA